MADPWYMLLQAARFGARSTALAPLQLPFVAALAATAYLAAGKDAPTWAIGIYIFIVAVLLICIVVAYFYFMSTKNVDALRSEAFILRKMEIQSRLGDSEKGELPPGEIIEGEIATETQKMLSDGSEKQNED